MLTLRVHRSIRARFRFRNSAERAISSSPASPASTEIHPLNPTSGEQAEDGVVIVQPFAGLTVLQRRRVARGAVTGREVVERGARRQVPIGGVHGDDTVTHLFQKLHRIEAADKRVRRIVLNAEVRRINLLDDFEENVFRLRELGVAPGPVLVVILHAEHDVVTFGILERSANALERPRDAVIARESRKPLAAQRAAMSRAQGVRSSRWRPFDVRPAGAAPPDPGCVKSGEKQIIDVICPVSSIARRMVIDAVGVEAPEEAVVMLDPFPTQASPHRGSTVQRTRRRQRARRTGIWERR